MMFQLEVMVCVLSCLACRQTSLTKVVFHLPRITIHDQWINVWCNKGLAPKIQSRQLKLSALYDQKLFDSQGFAPDSDCQVETRITSRLSLLQTFGRLATTEERGQWGDGKRTRRKERGDFYSHRAVFNGVYRSKRPEGVKFSFLSRKSLQVLQTKHRQVWFKLHWILPQCLYNDAGNIQIATCRSLSIRWHAGV